MQSPFCVSVHEKTFGGENWEKFVMEGAVWEFLERGKRLYRLIPGRNRGWREC
jgi:hypothetical protein